MGSRIRLFSRISPCCGPCGYRHWGRGPTGRGNLFPLPCLSRSRHLAHCQPPPRPRLCRQRHSYALRWHPHPAPSWRAGSVLAIPGEQSCPGWSRREVRIRFFSRLSPCTGPWEYRPWGRRPAGRGNLFPLSCLPHSNHLTSRRLHLAGISAGNSRPSCREGQRPGVYPVSVRARPFAGYLRAVGHGRYRRRGAEPGRSS